MAVLIPALSTCKRTMTPGEKLLGERLEQKLEDDYLIWYEPAIGPRALHPDFLVLHPRRGIKEDRNTAEILDFAYQFAKDVLQPADMDDDGVPLIQPQSSARAGRKPEVIKLPRFEDKLKAVIERFQSLEREGWHYSDMALVYRYQWQADQAEKLFQRCGIPVKWLKQANKSKSRALVPQQADAVNFVTMHSSKGLEFPVVAVAELPDVEKLPEEKREEEVRLAYVAMMRATEVLVSIE